MPKYMIEVQRKGFKHSYYMFIDKENVVELCRFLNKEIAPQHRVLAVYQNHDMHKKKDERKKLLFSIEYEMQHFFETLEERLIEKYRLWRVKKASDKIKNMLSEVDKDVDISHS